MAIDPTNGDVWVTSYDQGLVTVFNSQWQWKTNFSHGTNELNAAGLAIDHAGNVWIAHGPWNGGTNVAHLRTDGTFVTNVALGTSFHASAVAKEKGARVIVIEGAEERLEFAKSFGADHLIDLKKFAKVDERMEQVKKISESDGADVVLEVSGVPSAFTEALQLVRTGGRVVGIGNILTGPEFETSIAPGVITRKGITVKGIVRYAPHYLYRSLKFLERNHRKYPYEKFSDREYSLGEAKEALERSESRSIARAIIAPK